MTQFYHLAIRYILPTATWAKWYTYNVHNMIIGQTLLVMLNFGTVSLEICFDVLEVASCMHYMHFHTHQSHKESHSSPLTPNKQRCSPVLEVLTGFRTAIPKCAQHNAYVLIWLIGCARVQDPKWLLLCQFSLATHARSEV